LGPAQFQVATIPDAWPFNISVLPVQIDEELDVAIADEGGAFTDTLTVAVEFPHAFPAVTV